MLSAIPPISLLSSTAARQATLRARYERAPGLAWATHMAWTQTPGDTDPFRGHARVGLDGRELTYAVDDSVGGPHDEVAPGELFCAAVAQCVDSTVRMVAARMGITVDHLCVIVTGDVDARGALGEPGVPVGLQSMRVEIQVDLAAGARPGSVERLVAGARSLSPLLQTVMAGVAVEVVTGEGG